MPVKAKFCSQCGSEVVTRILDERPREVCPACKTVFYQNPLPVAASVVLNKSREALLVKRRNDPHRGEWCLPIGFAELGETIGQAARRELREETGIEGQIIRLLDADSFDSEFYGELLHLLLRGLHRHFVHLHSLLIHLVLLHHIFQAHHIGISLKRIGLPDGLTL